MLILCVKLQEKAYQSIQEVYKGAVPEPHDFDRIEYIKALHTVQTHVLCSTDRFTDSSHRRGLDTMCPFVSASLVKLYPSLPTMVSLFLRAL